MAPVETVSCVIPVRNGEDFFAATLDSVFAQSHPPLEVLVVDNGSTDGSVDLARSYGDGVRVFSQPDLGPAAARRRGVANARGDFVCFTDADDLFHPEKTERQLRRFAERPDLLVSLCLYERIWEAGLEDERERYRAAGRLRGSHGFGTMLARRSVFDVVGPIDHTRLHGDQVEWLARARGAGIAIDVLDEVLAYRRMHPNSYSHADPSFDSYLDIVKQHLDRRAGRAG
jgi:glycosyltransferase involved in cell wall biosynthesis